MLENIKSVYILRHILSNVSEKKILLLIIHNKRLQSKLNKSFFHYPILSGKYIIYESPNKAKIYNAFDDSIMYEGEYSNGKKNGKIKEYDKNGKLLFEGEYINDYRVDDTIFSYGDKFESEEIYENRIFDIIIY